MVGIPLPQRVAKTVGGEIVFLGGEKQVGSDFGVTVRSRLQTLGTRLKALMLGSDPCTWQQARKGTPGARASDRAWQQHQAADTWRGAVMPYALGKPARLAKHSKSKSTGPPVWVCRHVLWVQTPVSGSAAPGAWDMCPALLTLQTRALSADSHTGVNCDPHLRSAKKKNEKKSIIIIIIVNKCFFKKIITIKNLVRQVKYYY